VKGRCRDGKPDGHPFSGLVVVRQEAIGLPIVDDNGTK